MSDGTNLVGATAVAALVFGCGGESGSLRVTASGEEAATEGWPTSNIGFVDGWSMRFSTLVVNLGRLELRGDDGARETFDQPDSLVALTNGEQVLHEWHGVGARRWEDVRYAVVPATADSVDVGPVDPSVRRAMIEEGWSVYLEATAERGGEARTLAWGLNLNGQHSRCSGSDGTAGLVVARGALTEAEITLHWDHLFFDSLRLEDAEMRFDAMSAVAEPDGSVTFDGLDRQRLADLRGADGSPLLDGDGSPVVYDPGSHALEEPTLLHHMLAAATTVGHWNGEGHCDYQAF